MTETDQAAASDQAEMRGLRVENKDLRFERDRYRASAADYQEKLIASLDMLDQARSLHDVAEQMRVDLVDLAREFKARVTLLRGDAEKVRGELVALEQRRGEIVAALARAHEDELRHEVIALVTELRIKLAEQAVAPNKSRWWH